MNVMIAILALTLPQLVTAQCFQCPLGCSCDPQETLCSDITEIPSCLPYPPYALTISNSPYLTQILSNAFAHESFANLETITITGAALYDIRNYAYNGTRRLQKIVITGTSGPAVLNRYTLYGLDGLLYFEATSIKNFHSIGYRTFSATPSLKTLKLHGNNIKFIDSQALESTYGLEYFDISNNPDLKSIPQNLLSHIGTLRTIYMNDCSLSTLYTNYFYQSYMTNALQEFSSVGNSWDCDENMCPVVSWLNSHYDLVAKARLGTCELPIILYNYPLQYLNARDVCPSPDFSNTISLYATIAAASLILLALCAIIYRRREALCCCRNGNQNYSYIDDNNVDIIAHDRAAAQCPNPPNYEAVVASSAPAKPEEQPPSYNDDDDIAPPDYEE